MIRSVVRVCGALVLLTLFSAGSVTLAQQPGTGRPPPSVVVERIEVSEAENPSEYSARVEAIEAVDIRARVEGFVQKVAFDAGASIEAGDLLFEIEPDRYEAAVAAAKANVAQADAVRRETEATLARTQRLFERGTAAEATLDQAQAAFDQAVAEAEAARAALRADELDLSYTRVTAPISGQIGRAVYTTGNLVSPESGPLARIVQLDPIRVVFSVPEGLVVTLRQRAKRGGNIEPGALRLTLRLPNGTEYSEAGRIEYAESEVNPQTGTVSVRTVFPNADHLLIPGQFVTLLVREAETPMLPVVPQSAVLQDRKGRFVYVLEEGNIVSQRRIKTGDRVENGWAVTEGLRGGEPVVVQGIQRLSEGLAVQPTAGQPIGTDR